LNGLKIWATDIAGAYLKAFTNEKVCIIAGPEFGDHAGHTLIIERLCMGYVLEEPIGMTSWLIASVPKDFSHAMQNLISG